MVELELTKEQFVEIINHIEEQLDKDDKLSDLMVCEDTTGWIVTAPHLITDIISLLTMMLDDQAEWISWWLWEVADDKSNANVYIDGIKYAIKTPSDLYHLIRNELEDIETQEPCTENINRDGATHVVVDSNSEISLYDIFTSAINKYVESEN